jgi:hypothetical protein
MIDFIDIFDVYQQGKIAGLGSLQADTDRRVTKSATVCAWCGGKLTSGDPFHST